MDEYTSVISLNSNTFLKAIETLLYCRCSPGAMGTANTNTNTQQTDNGGLGSILGSLSSLLMMGTGLGGGGGGNSDFGFGEDPGSAN